jgi:hypothetical protein
MAIVTCTWTLFDRFPLLLRKKPSLQQRTSVWPTTVWLLCHHGLLTFNLIRG